MVSDTASNPVSLTAARAQAGHLDGLLLDLETEIRGTVRHHPADGVVAELRRHPATPADQELAAVGIARVDTPDKSIARFNAMNEAVGEQELEGPVHRRRRRRAAVEAKDLQDRIGPDRLVAAPHQLENPPPHRGQTGAAPLAQRRRRRQGVGDTTFMVVRSGRKGKLMCHLWDRIPRGRIAASGGMASEPIL